MLVKDIERIEGVRALDHVALREILHPERDAVPISYSVAHAIVQVGEASLPHRLTSSEVYYILSGSGEVHVGGESQPVRPGQAIHIPPNSVQWIENTGTGELAFLCIVDPPWGAFQESLKG